MVLIDKNQAMNKNSDHADSDANDTVPSTRKSQSGTFSAIFLKQFQNPTPSTCRIRTRPPAKYFVLLYVKTGAISGDFWSGHPL